MLGVRTLNLSISDLMEDGINTLMVEGYGTTGASTKKDDIQQDESKISNNEHGVTEGRLRSEAEISQLRRFHGDRFFGLGTLPSIDESAQTESTMNNHVQPRTVQVITPIVIAEKTTPITVRRHKPAQVRTAEKASEAVKTALLEAVVRRRDKLTQKSYAAKGDDLNQLLYQFANQMIQYPNLESAVEDINNYLATHE